MLLPHALAVFIAAGVPILNVYGLRRLKKQATSTSKIMTYLQTIIVLWVMTGLIWYVSTADRLIYFQHQYTLSGIVMALFIICSIYLIIVTITPLILMRHPAHRQQMQQSFQARAFIMPLTTKERAWFAIVAVSVGICEEIIFRSFLTQYFMHHPFELSVIISTSIAMLIFAYGHFHQGLNGVINAAVFAFVMSILFMITGSLLLPIFIHIIYDLRILVLTHASS